MHIYVDYRSQSMRKLHFVGRESDQNKSWVELNTKPFESHLQFR